MVVSTELSEASIFIGFISFVSTLLTLTRVLWSEISTLADAPDQVHLALSNLKEALFEEREAVRRISQVQRRNSRGSHPHPHHQHRRRSSTASRRIAYDKTPDSVGGYGYATGMDVKIMRESIRTLCQRFTEVERPFLGTAQLSPREKASANANYNWDAEETATRYHEDGFENDYRSMTLGLRFKWLRSKSQVEALWVLLNRFQMRRIAREVMDGLIEIRHLDRQLRDLQLIPDQPQPPPQQQNQRQQYQHHQHLGDSEPEDESRVHVRRSRSNHRRRNG